MGTRFGHKRQAGLHGVTPTFSHGRSFDDSVSCDDKRPYLQLALTKTIVLSSEGKNFVLVRGDSRRVCLEKRLSEGRPTGGGFKTEEEPEERTCAKLEFSCGSEVPYTTRRK